MITLSVSEVLDIRKNIEEGDYKYCNNFVGHICSGTDEGDNGLYHFVILEDDDEGGYAEHVINIGSYIFVCHEDQEHRRKWYLKVSENYVSDMNFLSEDLCDLLNSIVIPFDFEAFAVESFDSDAIAEGIPNGDPYCLLVDGCAFMIEDDVEDYSDQKVREILNKHNWSTERIDKAIERGYELNPDVWGICCELPVVYLKGFYDTPAV